MAEDPRIASIRRAFEEAHFDERTPDEKGFADVFEKELKPKLIEGIAANLEEAVVTRRVGLSAAGLLLVVIVMYFFAAALKSSPANKDGGIWFIVAVAAFGLLGATSRIFKRKPEDPNRVFVIGALLERFGCRVEGSTFYHKAILFSPIRPDWDSYEVQPRKITGRLDGLEFDAMRIKGRRLDGNEKKTVFCGWHLVVDLPFTFNGTTTIRDRGARAVYKDGLELRDLTLEDPEFGRRFVAQTDDQVEARVILSPDVIHHLTTAAAKIDRGTGGLLLGFSGAQAHVWIPSDASALSDWQPLHPTKLIQDLHEAFAEMAEIRAFLRDIDVIAESEGFRAQAARNTRAS